MPWERENLLSHQGKNTAAEGGSSLYKRPLVLFITQLKRKKEGIQKSGKKWNSQVNPKYILVSISGKSFQ